MARRGRKRRLELESEYWRLLLSGVGTFEACRIVGGGRKTGYGGVPRTAVSPQCWSPSRPAVAGSCPYWSVNESRHYTGGAWACGRSPRSSTALR